MKTTIMSILAISLITLTIGNAHAEMVREDIVETNWMYSIDRDFVCEGEGVMNMLVIFTNNQISVNVVAEFDDGTETYISEIYTQEEYGEKEQSILEYIDAWTKC